MTNPPSTITPGEGARKAAREIAHRYYADDSDDAKTLANIASTVISEHFPPTEPTQAGVEAAAKEIAELLVIKPEFVEQWTSRFVPIISKHCAVPAEAGEVERLRTILRTQRETIKHWQHHVLITSRLLGCIAIDKEVEAAIDDLKHNLAIAHSTTIQSCIDIVNNASIIPFAGVAYVDRDQVVRGLEGLVKGEGKCK